MKRSERPPPDDILETGGKTMMITEQMIYPAILMITISAYCIAGDIKNRQLLGALINLGMFAGWLWILGAAVK